MVEGTPRITYLISTLEVGGAQRGMERLLGPLCEDYAVTVVALRGLDGAIVPDLPKAVEVVDLDVRHPWHGVRLRRLHRELRNTDVLVCSMFHASIVGNAFGSVAPVPTILTWRHLEAYERPFRERLYGWSIRQSDRVLADSEAVTEILERRYGSLADRIHTVPIAGVDTERYVPQSRSGDGTTIVGILGRLVQQKNHDAVLAVADCLRDEPIRFEIAGKGPREQELRRRVEQLDLKNIRFKGFVDDVPTFLNGLDIYVQPSHNEGLCITAVEAMACGLPVVAYAVGGLTETVVAGETGYLVEPGDEGRLAERIRSLLVDPELRSRLGTAGRERVIEQYSRDVLVSRFREALESALAE